MTTTDLAATYRCLALAALILIVTTIIALRLSALAQRINHKEF